jgi:hypothetical protein
MKDTYKPPHTSPDNMNTRSTTSKLDLWKNNLRKFRMNINEKLDKKLDEKLEKFKKMRFNFKKLMGMQTQGIPEENHGMHNTLSHTRKKLLT